MSFRRSQSNSKRNEPLNNEVIKPRNDQSKWLLARQVIASSLPRVDDTKKTEAESLPLVSDSSFTAIEIKPENGLDKPTLDQLVEDENFEKLEKLGGVEGVAAALGASLENGLSGDDDVASQRELFGANEFKNPPRSFFRTVRRALLDRNINVIMAVCKAVSLGFGFPMDGPAAGIVWRALFNRSIVIMAICGALTLYFGIPVDGMEGLKVGASIFVAIFLAVGVVYVSEYYHYKVLVELHGARENVLVDVIRGGRRQKIPMLEIVVGDVVFLKPGDLVPSHGLLVDNNYQKLKLLDRESPAERGDSRSDDVELKPIGQRPFLLSGTKVVDGFARMLVTSVGINESKISHNFRDETVLEHQLGTLDKITDLAGYALAFLFLMFTLVGSNFDLSLLDENGEVLEGMAKANEIVKIVVGIITTVVDIPDPWKLSLSLTWACAMKKLIAHNALVLKPSALEALSYANTIFFVAANKTKVVEFWLPSGKQFREGRAYELLEEGIALNNSSGGLTEKAILTWATKDLKIDIEKAR